MPVACDPGSIYHRMYQRSSSQSELAQGQSILEQSRDNEDDNGGDASVEQERVVGP